MTTPSRSALLLLIDSRLPTGAHTHSGGIEVAVEDGRVVDAHSLAKYLQGRLATVGLVDGALVAATARQIAPLATLQMEAAARCVSPALRRASESQARGLLRAARRLFPTPELDRANELVSVPGWGQAPRGGANDWSEHAFMMWPIALGLVVRAAGLSPHDGALVAAHSSITGPAWAAVRLLGLDPFVVIEQIASLVDDIDEVSLRADLLAATVESPHELPSVGSLLQDISAEHHASWEVRLFVS